MADKPELVTGEDGRKRCAWGATAPDYIPYHDHEWGRPIADDVRLFEKICLEGFQSGLSWLTILRKRENFRQAFAGFDFHKVARFRETDVERLLADAGIVRHRGKIESTVNNAKRAVALEREAGSLAAYFWQYQPEGDKKGGLHGRVADSRIGCAVEGPQEARLELRRADHLLRLHAGHGPGQRPPSRLLVPQGGRAGAQGLRPPGHMSEEITDPRYRRHGNVQQRRPSMEMAYRERWQAEIAALQSILSGFDLTEECKWGKPCYTMDGRNVVIIQGFKEYCALGFFQGALLKDPKKLLVQLGQVQAARVMKFTGAKEIATRAATIKAYVREAMAVAKAGLKVDTKPRDIPIPEELEEKFRSDPQFKRAFDALTPGRRRGYLFHFAAAKQSRTRIARIEKAMPAIFKGRGFLERR